MISSKLSLSSRGAEYKGISLFQHGRSWRKSLRSLERQRMLPRRETPAWARSVPFRSWRARPAVEPIPQPPAASPDTRTRGPPTAGSEEHKGISHFQKMTLDLRKETASPEAIKAIQESMFLIACLLPKADEGKVRRLEERLKNKAGDLKGIIAE
nr:hypothetical protein Iba_chr15bCG9830 [Ipomoea batatas]